MILSQFGCEDQDLLADDFLFIFPVVGPLRKQEFVKVGFKPSLFYKCCKKIYELLVSGKEAHVEWVRISLVIYDREKIKTREVLKGDNDK